LDELQAAILRVKLKHLDQWNEARRKRALIYSRMLEWAVRCPIENEPGRHVYHLYVIGTRERDALQAFLRENGIETFVHYPVPIHLQKAYRGLGYGRGDLPLTEQCSREILSLPIYPEIGESEIEEVAKKILFFLGSSVEGPTL
jgi:dTDP-4-amino-4,6-dideoxygalactose transaminase